MPGAVVCRKHNRPRTTRRLKGVAFAGNPEFQQPCCAQVKRGGERLGNDSFAVSVEAGSFSCQMCATRLSNGLRDGSLSLLGNGWAMNEGRAKGAASELRAPGERDGLSLEERALPTAWTFDECDPGEPECGRSDQWEYFDLPNGCLLLNYTYRL